MQNPKERFQRNVVLLSDKPSETTNFFEQMESDMTLEADHSPGMPGSISHEVTKAMQTLPTNENYESLVDHQRLPQVDDIPEVEDQSQTAGRSLEDLPNEILLFIIRNLRYSGCVYSLARCSSRFRDLALPTLYTKAVFEEGMESLPIFMCSMLARPDLARYLQSFQGKLFEIEEDEFCDMSRLTIVDKARISTAVRITGTSDNEAEKWIESIKAGGRDAIVALILSVSPNINELSCDTWFTDIPRFTTIVFRRAVDLQIEAEISPLAMTNLREISLS